MDAIYTGLAWLPGMALVIGTGVAVLSALAHLEAATGATSYVL